MNGYNAEWNNCQQSYLQQQQIPEDYNKSLQPTLSFELQQKPQGEH